MQLKQKNNPAFDICYVDSLSFFFFSVDCMVLSAPSDVKRSFLGRLQNIVNKIFSNILY